MVLVVVVGRVLRDDDDRENATRKNVDQLG